MKRNLTRRARAYPVIDVLALVFQWVVFAVMVAVAAVGIRMDAGVGDVRYWLWATSLVGLPVMLVVGVGVLRLGLSGVLFGRLGVAPCPKCGGGNVDGNYNELKCLDCGFSTWFHNSKGAYTWWEVSAGECQGKNEVR